MCSVCGCGGGEHRIEGAHFHYDNPHPPGHRHDHGRLIEIEQNILAKNQHYADQNRADWQRRGIFTINFISSPGAGKTTLLVETVKPLKAVLPVAVVEGDQETANDADRIRAVGVPAIQINTGKGCHLDAHMVGHAVGELQPSRDGVMFIENVGNLVCPCGFDLGEDKRAVLLSVTEGDDKPVKYPDAFASADIMIICKMDLAPYVDFDVSKASALARELNPALEIVELSAKTGVGMAQWLNWIKAGAANSGGVGCTN